MKHSEIDARNFYQGPSRYGPSAAREHTAWRKKMSSRTVDIHSHVAVPAAAAIVAPYLDPLDVAMDKFSSDETRAINAQQGKDRGFPMTDIADRLAVNDAMGIDMQLICPPPPQCYYTIPVEPAVKATQIVNDGIAAYAAQHPNRFAGLGSVPLQDCDAAVAELNRCVKTLGLKGVEILTSVNGEELSAPRLEEFWRQAEALDCLVMLHPNGFSEGTRFVDHYFSNVIGNPLDTTVALHRLIFDGVLEKFQNLKILAVHGGGYLPAYSGRIDHAWGARTDSRAGLPNPPTHYLRKVYFDSIVFTPHQLEYLVELYGADQILMGTDYPFDMADYDPVGHILAASKLSDGDRSKIAGGNALALLNL